MVGIAWIEGVKGIEGIDNLYVQLRIMIPSLSLSPSHYKCVYNMYTHIYIDIHTYTHIYIYTNI